MKDCGRGSADLPTLTEGLEIERSDFEPEDATLTADHLLQVVEIVIGGFQLSLRLVLCAC